MIRDALDVLTVNLDATKAGANVISRKRAVFHSILEYGRYLLFVAPRCLRRP